MTLDIRVSGHPLALECFYGEVVMTSVWPGGSGELSWTATGFPARLANGGALCEAYYGGKRVWYGTLNEPDPSQDQMVAQGLWRLGDNYPALDGSGDATAVPNTAIDQAIAAGLPWTRLATISASAADADLSSGPLTIGALLDTWADNNTTRWGIDLYGNVYAQPDTTIPTYQVRPLEGGLGFALDNYACTLIGRFTSSTGLATTIPVTDELAKFQHGNVTQTVDLTSRGVITEANAEAILASLLALGKAIPEWTAGVAVTYGELLSQGGTPVALENVQAGRVLRVHGGADLARKLSGAMYVDMLIGQTSLDAGVLTLQPLTVAIRSLPDAITAALSKKKVARG